jgi:hypothetical protein
MTAGVSVETQCHESLLRHSSLVSRLPSRAASITHPPSGQARGQAGFFPSYADLIRVSTTKMDSRNTCGHDSRGRNRRTIQITRSKRPKENYHDSN